MARVNRASFEKKRRERAKKQKRLDKLARRQERKALRESGRLDADGDGETSFPLAPGSAQDV